MNKNRKTLLCCIFFIISMMICSPLVITYYCLPKEIQLFAGVEQQYDLKLPIRAKLSYQDTLQLSVEDQLVKDQAQVSLDRPIGFKMNEEGTSNLKISVLGGIPLKTVSVNATCYKEVIPCGRIVGIRVNTKGIIVLGVGSFIEKGSLVAPCKELIKDGDVILTANEIALTTKEVFKEMIETSGEMPIRLTILRNNQILKINIAPRYSKDDNEYKLGLWIRDSTQGIGTMTYYDPNEKVFGALGHGITDVDTNLLMPIQKGEIYEASITHIKKGEKGSPGELGGTINSKVVLGEIASNTVRGIHGELNELGEALVQGTPIPIATQNEVHEGKATVLVDLTGERIEAYEIYIQKVSRYSNEPTKGMIIKITDKNLLSRTNGIVQGMSGSPIIQDNKLVGAITHVFVQDATRGYGIFIENMINSENNN